MSNLPDEDFWLTRDRTDGVLSDFVEIWLARPERQRHVEGDVLWIAPLNVVDRKTTFFGELALKEAVTQFGNSVPLTDGECIRIDKAFRG